MLTVAEFIACGGILPLTIVSLLEIFPVMEAPFVAIHQALLLETAPSLEIPVAMAVAYTSLVQALPLTVVPSPEIMPGMTLEVFAATTQTIPLPIALSVEIPPTMVEEPAFSLASGDIPSLTIVLSPPIPIPGTALTRPVAVVFLVGITHALPLPIVPSPEILPFKMAVGFIATSVQARLYVPILSEEIPRCKAAASIAIAPPVP